MSTRWDFDLLFSVIYEELRRLAATIIRRDPSATLNPTGLVHEAWLKLAGSPEVAHLPHNYFKRIAARAMRQVLVEASRRRNASKRGGDLVRVESSEALAQPSSSWQNILALDEALQELQQANPRHVAVIEARYFGGFTTAETAELLGISEETVLRDWQAAKAWLAYRLR